MALQNPLGFRFPIPLLKGDSFPLTGGVPGVLLPVCSASQKSRPNLGLSSANFSKNHLLSSHIHMVRATRIANKVEFSDGSSDEESDKTAANTREGTARDGDDDKTDDIFLMDDEEREEWRRKIRQVIDASPDVEEASDPEERLRKMQQLLADYPLVVEEDDPDWPEDADGWGFNFDQFFNKITIKNVKKDDDEDYDSDKEIVWQDDDYIRPIKDITTREWEDTVFKDFNPLVILVHNRYKRPRQNERARSELEKAVQMFWESGLPSPRCAAVDAVIEQDLVSALKVSIYPEIIFTKAGKILHRDNVVRTADEWSKMMAFFYYKAVRPSWLDKTVGQSREKIPSLS